jgi:hypothetical protein
VEEVREVSGTTITNEEVFMATKFGEFRSRIVTRLRGGGEKKAATYHTVKMHVNKMDIRSQQN